MNLFDLTNKVIAITGGYGYLGKSISEGLAEAGATVYVLGKTAEKFHAAFPTHPHIHFTPCDISHTPSIQAALAAVYEQNGRFDVLINNAFYLQWGDPLHTPDDTWQHSIDGTLNSTYRCIREAVPYFQKQGSGKIINVSSMYGIVSPDFAIYTDAPASLNPPHYGAAKAGLLQLTRYFAWYLGPQNIQANAVSPGAFPNPQVQQNEKFIAALQQKTALKRIGNPKDLQGAFIFLSADASNYVTGHNLVVDGGWTAS